MPLALKLRGKSTTQSYRAAIFYADITVRDGMTLEAAIAQARETHAQRQAVGFDQQELDQAARVGFQMLRLKPTKKKCQKFWKSFIQKVTAIQSRQWILLKSSRPREGRV
jgi:hypothetical protein